MQQETMRGSLFPLFPLRVKCQNHERVPISPISPILVANVYSSCQNMDHQNRGNRDPLSVFPWWSAKTMRGSLFPLFPIRVKCQNHERVPSSISPILVANVYSSCQDMDHQNRGNRNPLLAFPGDVPKPWEGPYSLFPLRVKCQNHERVPIPLFSGPIFSSCQDMDHQNRGNRGNRGNRDPLNFSLDEVPKPWKGPYFPYFGGQCLFILSRHGEIGEIGAIATLSWFWQFTLRGNRGNRDPLSVFPWWSAKTMKGSLFPLFWWPMSWQDDKAWTTKIGEIGEIGTLSWFWHFTLRGNRGNRDPLMVLKERRYVCGYVLTFFGDWLVHASDVMVAMDENMYD